MGEPPGEPPVPRGFPPGSLTVSIYPGFDWGITRQLEITILKKVVDFETVFSDTASFQDFRIDLGNFWKLPRLKQKTNLDLRVLFVLEILEVFKGTELDDTPVAFTRAPPSPVDRG